MRLVFVLAICGCSSVEGPAALDASTPSCATTSCVAGAECRLPNGGGTCHCFEPGQWTCGASGRPPSDAGFSVDVWAPPLDTAFTAPPADRAEPTYYFGLSEGGCGDRVAACDDSTTTPLAEKTIESLMRKCALSCTRLRLFTDTNGCPEVVMLNVEWVDGALKCVVSEIGKYRWPCARTFDVSTRSCPE